MNEAGRASVMRTRAKDSLCTERAARPVDMGGPGPKGTHGPEGTYSVRHPLETRSMRVVDGG